MRCGSCGAEIVDPEAAFCSRCGGPVGERGGSATEPIEQGAAPGPGGERSPRTDAGSGRAHDTRTIALAGDLAVAVRRSFVSGGWPQASAAAAVGFAAVLATGAVLVVAFKLAVPDFAVGRSAFVVLTYIVLAGLTSLGAPVGPGGGGSALVPLGGLALIGWALVWSGRRYVGARAATTPKERALEGAKLGAPLAVMCFLAALVFRVRDADVGAAPALALLLGGFWGALFGAAGGPLTQGRLGDLVTGRLAGARARSSLVRAGLVAGGLMLAGTGILGMGGALLYLIGVLAAGSGVDITSGEAVAIVLLLVLFAPNIAAGTVAFSLGAPHLFLARSFGVGIERHVSLFGFGDAPAAWYLYLALLIPIAACTFAGYVARRTTDEPGKPAEILGVAALVFATVLTLAVVIGTLDYAGGVLGEGALLMLQPAPGAVFLLALAWAGGLGYAGWKIAANQR